MVSQRPRRRRRQAVAVSSNEYGKLLVQIRKDEMDLSQDAFARLLHVKRETVSRWENGILKVAPGPETLALLSRISGHSVPEFLIAIGFDLSPLIIDGQTTIPERLAQLRGGVLRPDEAELLALYRRLPQAFRRVVIRQVHAALPDPEGEPGADA